MISLQQDVAEMMNILMNELQYYNEGNFETAEKNATLQILSGNVP